LAANPAGWSNSVQNDVAWNLFLCQRSVS
jgi:hypothetical protein